MIEKLIYSKIYRKENEQLVLLPDGVFLWNKIVEYLKGKFDSLGYKEIYSLNLDSFIKNEEKVPSEYYCLKQCENKIDFISYGKYLKEIEEAKNKTIDVLEIYNQLGKELLAIPFISGKNAFNPNQNYLTSIFGEGIINSTYLEKYENSFLTTSNIDTRIIDILINVHKDEKGIVFPPKIAPTQIVIIPLKQNEKGVLKECRSVKDLLINEGFRVLLDESSTSTKEKKEYYLSLGIPLIIEIGPRDLERGVIEYIVRDEDEINDVAKEDLVYEINSIFKKMQKRLYIKALEYLLDNQKDLSKDSVTFENCRVSKIMWCGDQSCLNEATNNLSIISFNQQRTSEYCYFCQKKSKHQVSIIKKI